MYFWVMLLVFILTILCVILEMNGIIKEHIKTLIISPIGTFIAMSISVITFLIYNMNASTPIGLLGGLNNVMHEVTFYIIGGLAGIETLLLSMASIYYIVKNKKRGKNK